MNIFVAGATGVIGRRVIPRLVRAGHDVHAVARRTEAVASLRANGVVPVAVDLFDPVAVRRAVAASRADAVVNLATSIPPMRESWRRTAWRANDRLRTVASAHLVDAATAAGVQVFVQESVAFLYGDHADLWITEDAPLADTWFTPAVRAAEHHTSRFAEGGAGVVLRFGGFMAPEAEATVALLRAARRGILLEPGARRGYFPWVDVEDAAAAVESALTWRSGTYHVVDDAQMTRLQKSRVLATAVGRRRPLMILPEVLTYLAGGAGATARRSMRVSNAAARAAGWTPSRADPLARWKRLAAGVLADEERLLQPT